ncbi:MAG: hypothetical protein KAR55_04760 [Thermoplasmatales archaeon]|nr:hypothetical protein [Thermoplasmatales archaeon]
MKEFGRDFQTLSQFTNILLRQAEHVIKIASKASLLTDIAAGYLSGDIQIRDYRGRLLLYYILDRIKDAFGLI